MSGDETFPPKHFQPATELTIEAVFDAYFECRKNKRNTLNQLAFEVDLESNLVALWHDLKDGKYKIGHSIAFVVTYPKIREIWAADFRDRVVHHLIYNAIAERFYRRFIRDSYGCIPERGTLDGKNRIYGFARAITQGWSRPAFFLKTDIANFFNSIDRKRLLDLVLARVPEPWLATLITQVVLHDPRLSAVYKSSPAMFAKVPAHKSLRLAAENIGLPIGNLTSQFFANVYMDELDQFIKRKLKAKYYGRYVDDMVLLHENPDVLNAWQVEIDTFLHDRLGLALHPKKTQLNHIDKGINFVGYIIKPGRCYLRRSTVAACKRRIYRWEKAGSPVDKREVLKIGTSVNSYLGMLRHVDGYGVRTDICAHFSTLFLHPDSDFRKVIFL